MTRQALINLIYQKQTFLCIGLDTDPEKIPTELLDFEDPVFEFNKAIIDATHDLAVAYKPNFAFYEAQGVKGMVSLVKTIRYINQHYKTEVLTIADAKRGDIGNTSLSYARAVFDPNASGMEFDAVTVAPYMGEDSVKPFLSYEGKWAILLALTSNKGAGDFQFFTGDGQKLFERVLLQSSKWGTPENMMYVVGATQAEMLQEVRKIVPDHFLLVPGIGAQGGNLEEVAKYGLTKVCGLLVNSSRNIIYAGNDRDYPVKARQEAMKVQQQMAEILRPQILVNSKV